MFYILKELSNTDYKEYDVYLVAKKNKIEQFDKLLKNHNISNVKIVNRASFKYLKI